MEFEVTRFEVTGENPIDEASTQLIVEPFLGKFSGLDSLLAASDALEEALKNRGYVFHAVTLPPQTLEGGVVIIRISAVRLGEIKVEGNEHFDEKNVLASLPSLTQPETPDAAQIAQNLAQLQRHPRKNTNIRLRQNEQTNALDATVIVEDKRPYQFFAGLNNIGTRQTGRTRLSIGGQHSNLFNLDHKATLSYTTSPENPGDVSQFSANYELPLYAGSSFITAFYSFSDVDVGQVGDFDVSGAGRFWGLNFTRLLRKRGRYRHEWSLGLQNRYFENNVDFLGNLPIGVDVRSFPITLAYRGRYSGENWSGSFGGSYSRNLAIKDRNDAQSYAASRSGAETDWDAIRFNANITYQLPHEWLARGYLDGQLAGEALIPGEQYGLGGWRSVRGLDERSVTGDNGLRATVETWTPAITGLGGLRLIAFFDIGFRDRENPQAGEVNSDTLSSVGVGARWQWQEQLDVTLDYGHTIAEGEGPTASAKDEAGVKWHFNVFYRF
ncbi:MAG: ShlB/FhaC/HecB family hemolysin secretion/activation protein [Gammaproteobacteria bacterium]